MPCFNYPDSDKSRYKDQELTAMEHMQRSQRPDIIEREVVGKSPPPREEHHSSMPQASHHPRDNSQSHGDNDFPEHYDLENSSSIAPSDIDIICHYKSELIYCRLIISFEYLLHDSIQYENHLYLVVGSFWG